MAVEVEDMKMPREKKPRPRREYGSGSVYERKDGRFVGTIEDGWTERGTRRRITVTGKSEAEVRRKLRDRNRERESGSGQVARRITVKQWAEEWLAIKRHELRPKAYNAAASPVRKWIIPTLGHRRLEALTPKDVRTLSRAQIEAGRKGATAAATQRTLFNMLRAAKVEGHMVPDNVLLTKMPTVGKSDREAPALEQGLKLLEVASRRANGSRWMFALLLGQRQGQCLGLTWDRVLPDGWVDLSWQLQPLPYVVPRDRSSGFRVPDEYEAVRLVDSYHLVRPKTSAADQVLPIGPVLAAWLEYWRQHAPASPHGLVWPTSTGRPQRGSADLREWHGIQEEAGVRHRSGRYYHVHEARNFFASRADGSGASQAAVSSLLGQTNYRTSQIYINPERRGTVEAVERQSLLPLPPQSPPDLPSPS